MGLISLGEEFLEEDRSEVKLKVGEGGLHCSPSLTHAVIYVAGDEKVPFNIRLHMGNRGFRVSLIMSFI